MLEIILLIFGIFKALRRPYLNDLTADNFPDVDPEKFAVWQKTQLKATDILLWATWGAFFIKLLLRQAVMSMELPYEISVLLFVVVLVGWIVGLVFAYIYSGRATTLRVRAGIKWPESAKDEAAEHSSGALDSSLKCPSCSTGYRLADYDPSAKRIFCSACKVELPRS